MNEHEIPQSFTIKLIDVNKKAAPLDTNMYARPNRSLSDKEDLTLNLRFAYDGWA